MTRYSKNLAALHAKAQGYAEAMRIVAQSIHPVSITYGPGAFIPMDKPDQAVAKYPDRANVSTLRQEIQNTEGRIDSLTKFLREMGIAPL